MAETWPPDYIQVCKNRQKRYMELRGAPALLAGAKQYYSTHYSDFIRDWMVTYDPRGVGGVQIPVPFVMFRRQEQFLQFLEAITRAGVSGLIEKSRDMGATWLCCAFSVCDWLFQAGTAIGWGSRKEQLVDRIGDPDSIFEKIRIILRELPVFFLPEGFELQRHAAHMKIINPENGSTITGEAGDNIGRGGRKKIYFKDESAFYDRPELIEAALIDNTNVQVDMSSVNGPNNIFARRRMAGVDWYPGMKLQRDRVYVFVMDWRDHPAKDQEWYDAKRTKAEREGLMHIFRQEVDRDYAASVEGILIPRKWIDASIDADKKLELTGDGMAMAALDVANEGGDRNAIAVRRGVVLKKLNIWGRGDTAQSTNRAVGISRMNRCRYLFYDSIGVGSGVKAETNRMIRDGQLEKGILEIVGWNAASKPQFAKSRVIKGDRSSPTNREFFSNLKAQGWWELRKRFEKTAKMVHDGTEYEEDELISIPSRLKYLHELVRELSQVTYSHNGQGQVTIDKTPSGTTSPNAADSVMMCFWPVLPRKVWI